jgi:regulator of CtrA degradation
VHPIPKIKSVNGIVNEITAPTAFFGRTYDEAVALLVEARNYVAYEEAFDRESLDLFQRLVMSCETTRLTARLTHIMSWLLFQKAIYVGEIGRSYSEQARCRLSGHQVCLDDKAETEGELPSRLLTLLTRSRRLYVRVARLDELLIGD